MSRKGSSARTQPCSPEQARSRLEHARKFLEVADLLSDQAGDVEYASVSASLAVLAGIAASDAACCAALGRRSRGDDHRQATGLVEQIEPGGSRAANSLRRLLNLKDEAQYGFYDVGGQNLQAARRQARVLVEFAEGVLQRRPA